MELKFNSLEEFQDFVTKVMPDTPQQAENIRLAEDNNRLRGMCDGLRYEAVVVENKLNVCEAQLTRALNDLSDQKNDLSDQRKLTNFNHTELQVLLALTDSSCYNLGVMLQRARDKVIDQPIVARAVFWEKCESRINAIKTLRSIMGWDLRTAKEWIEAKE